MIDMLIALWDLLRSSFVCLGKGIVGVVMVATIVAVPVLIAGIIWKGFCLIFSLEFSWLIPLALVCLAWYMIITAGGEE